MAVATANGNLTGMKASPLYFGYTDKSKQFINSWIETTKDIVENKVGIFDHEPLFILIHKIISYFFASLKAAIFYMCNYALITIFDGIIIIVKLLFI